MNDKPMITRNLRPFPEALDGRKVITQPLIAPESISATTDLIKTTPESIRKSWGIPPEDQIAKEYMAGLERIYSIPDTIEDEMPAVSQAFADKVKAMGGIMTPYGLICDPAAPVTGKRYMRLARALFCIVYDHVDRHVEDAEYRIRNYAQRNKNATDWEGMTAHFTKGLKCAIKYRHHPELRKPIYANKE